jgi:hypothetical protein
MASEIERSVISKLKRLPPERQREVLDFVEALERKGAASTTGSVDEIRALFRETQALPQVQTLTDDDVAAEIAAYRAGR